MKPVQRPRVAVVGAGSMGRNHLRLYGTLKYTELVGAYDINPEQAQTVLQEFGCPILESLEQVAAQVDAISLCTPSSTHEEIGLFFLERGIHCLIEKPLATSESACRALIAAAAANQLILLVGHVERFNPAVQQAIALINDGAEIQAIEARRLSAVSRRITDVDVVSDLMVHDLDIVYALVQDQVISVAAAGVRCSGLSGGDHVTALLGFMGGSMASVTASRISPNTVRDLSILTNKGLINVDYRNQSVEIYQDGLTRPMELLPSGLVNYAVDITMERIKVRSAEPLQRELVHFIDCVRGIATPEVSGEQGLCALQLVWRIMDNVYKNGTP